jgi:uncharacterized protein (DUF2141 family)
MTWRPLAVLLAAPMLLSAAPPPTVDVQVAITELRSSRGVVRACMTADPVRFPRCKGDANAYSIVVRASDATALDFAGVRPGTYAIALLHDENGNGRADRALGMMPKEGFGFSRDARVRLGPPAFDEAAFTVRDAPVRQTIRMRYML